jgi:hypothetical protein
MGHHRPLNLPLQIPIRCHTEQKLVVDLFINFKLRMFLYLLMHRCFGLLPTSQGLAESETTGYFSTTVQKQYNSGQR